MLPNLIIKKTTRTPEVNFDFSSGILEMNGVSIPENAKNFYQPIADTLQKYLQNPSIKTTFIFRFEYFNSSTTLEIVSFLRITEKVHKKSSEIFVIWYSEEGDEDMLDVGLLLEKTIKVPFQFREHPPISSYNII